jgi:BolA protein
MMKVKDQIIAKLRQSLACHFLEVSDDSHRHAGHAGNPSGGDGTHFTITIVSGDFKGQTRLARHRMIYALLQSELNGGVHALAIHARTPDEIS